jgi:hypothetical protein
MYNMNGSIDRAVTLHSASNACAISPMINFYSYRGTGTSVRGITPIMRVHVSPFSFRLLRCSRRHSFFSFCFYDVSMHKIFYKRIVGAECCVQDKYGIELHHGTADATNGA